MLGTDHEPLLICEPEHLFYVIEPCLHTPLCYIQMPH